MNKLNRYHFIEETTILQLRNGYVILMSPESYNLVKDYTWCMEGTGYAMSRTGGKPVKMHRIILGIKDKNVHVDHINGNKLDNRLSNLRLCSKHQNEFNSKIKSTNTTGYKGVSPYKGKYRAVITLNGKQKHLGIFKTKEQAAHIYNEYAKIYFGEFARLNKKEGKTL